MSHAAAADIVEKRSRPRDRVLAPALLVYGDYAFTPTGVIRNLTRTGASVRLESELRLPDRLWLIELAEGRAHDARVVWRRSAFVGLAFTASRDLRSTGAGDPLRQLWIDRLPRVR